MQCGYCLTQTPWSDSYGDLTKRERGTKKGKPSFFTVGKETEEIVPF